MNVIVDVVRTIISPMLSLSSNLAWQRTCKSLYLGLKGSYIKEEILVVCLEDVQATAKRWWFLKVNMLSTMLDTNININLEYLLDLKMSDCHRLQTLSYLPSSLKSLSLYGCRALHNVSGLLSCENLEVLTVTNSPACAKSLSVSFTYLTNLRVLAIDGFDIICVKELIHCVHLKKLNIMFTEQILGMYCIRFLPKLQDFGMNAVLHDDILANPVSKLKRLRLPFYEYSCAPLVQYTSLISVCLADSRILTSLDALRYNQHLESLDVSDCWSLSDITGLRFFTHLKILNLARCRAVSEVTSIGNCLKLENVNLNRCEQVTDIAAFKKLSCLKFVNLGECDRIRTLDPLMFCPIQRLHLGNTRCRIPLSLHKFINSNR
jgi:Leucine-rich repeat (LRR) protein